MNALGSVDGEGPGGIFIMDPETFDIRGRWELDRGPRTLVRLLVSRLRHHDHQRMGTPTMVENGVNAELLLAGKYGHRLHVWDLRKRRHRQVLELGAEQQMVLELQARARPGEDVRLRAGVVTSLKDLSGSVWLWHRDDRDGEFQIRKVIEIPATPADPNLLPPLLKDSAPCRRWSPT